MKKTILIFFGILCLFVTASAQKRSEPRKLKEHEVWECSKWRYKDFINFQVECIEWRIKDCSNRLHKDICKLSV